MMDVYDQRMDDVLDMIRQARTRGWWRQFGISDRDFIALETGASRISNYELMLVPGLFESGGEARRQDWIANQLLVRMTRQERLTDEEHPLELDAVIHETALRNPAFQPAVMCAQLAHLALINELPTVTFRVLPASTFSYEAIYGGFSILDFPSPGQPSICYALHALGDERQDKSEYVEPARLRFTHLRSLALEPEESVALIEQVAGELRSSREGASTVDQVGLRWRRSSFSGGTGGGNDNCVEVALAGSETAVRDSKDAAGPMLVVPATAWSDLLTHAQGS
jgi:hypothetical protein